MKLKSWTPLEIIETILALNLLVWGVIFLFPGNVFDTPRIKNEALYAQDWFWGVFLVVVGFSLIFKPKDSYFVLGRWLHTLAWLFWFSIAVLIAIRTFPNGINPPDFLFISIFSAIAFCHLTLYSRLIGVK